MNKPCFQANYDSGFRCFSLFLALQSLYIYQIPKNNCVKQVPVAQRHNMCFDMNKCQHFLKENVCKFCCLKTLTYNKEVNQISWFNHWKTPRCFPADTCEYTLPKSLLVFSLDKSQVYQNSLCFPPSLQCLSQLFVGREF